MCSFKSFSFFRAAPTLVQMSSEAGFQGEVTSLSHVSGSHLSFSSIQQKSKENGNESNVTNQYNLFDLIQIYIGHKCLSKPSLFSVPS